MVIYKFRDWIQRNKLHWRFISLNPNIIHLLEKDIDTYIDNFYLFWLSMNPNAIDILEKYPNKIDWQGLCCNPNAIHLLEKNIDHVNWDATSMHKS